MYQILIENVKISNDLLSCIKNNTKCTKTTYECLVVKLDTLLGALEHKVLTTSIEVEANELFQACNDVLREIMRYDASCNKQSNIYERFLIGFFYIIFKYLSSTTPNSKAIFISLFHSN